MDIHPPKNQQKPLFGAFYKVSMAIVFTLTLLSIPSVGVDVVYATELNPADQMKPAQPRPSLDSLQDNAAFDSADNNHSPNADRKPNNPPTWWTWLTGNSKKPASYHFIDILELLG